MLIVQVHVHVKPECIDAFKEATTENARSSVNEPGVARFDVIQRIDDPSQFILVEVYRSERATGEHRETKHYRTWRDKVAEMMAEPRTSLKYSNVFPEDESW